MVTLITVVTVRTLFLFLLSIPPKVLTSVWSNFEIGDLDFWRGEAYSKFFDFLDERGGFYYEVSNRIWSSTGISSNSTLLWKRWGDAPVHSIGVSLFAKKEQIVSPVPNLFWVRSRQKLTWVLITISIFSMTSVRALWYLSRFFLKKTFFSLGYRHEPFQHCPQGAAHKQGKCWCDESENFGAQSTIFHTHFFSPDPCFTRTDREWYSCLNRYDKLFEW